MLNEGWFPENGALHICAAQEICLIDNHYKPVHQWERDSFDDILEFVAEIMDWQKLRDIPVEDEKRETHRSGDKQNVASQIFAKWIRKKIRVEVI